MDSILKMYEFLYESSKPDFNVLLGDEYGIFDDMLNTVSLDDVSEDEIRKQCYNYKICMTECFGSLLSPNRKERRLNEGVNRTENIDDVRKDMTYKYKLSEWQFQTTDMMNDIKVCIIAANIDENIQMIIDDMESMGYYVNGLKSMVYKTYNYIAMRFDPKFPKDITDVVLNMSHIMHWTPKYNLEGIQNDGFVPKSLHSRFTYPPRVHFLKEEIDDVNLMTIGRDLNDSNNDRRNNGEYVLLVLDTEKLPDDVKFFGDSNYQYGVCTYNNVPYDCVDKVYYCNLNGINPKLEDIEL